MMQIRCSHTLQKQKRHFHSHSLPHKSKSLLLIENGQIFRGALRNTHTHRQTHQESNKQLACRTGSSATNCSNSFFPSLGFFDTCPHLTIHQNSFLAKRGKKVRENKVRKTLSYQKVFH